MKGLRKGSSHSSWRIEVHSSEEEEEIEGESETETDGYEGKKGEDSKKIGSLDQDVADDSRNEKLKGDFSTNSVSSESDPGPAVYIVKKVPKTGGIKIENSSTTVGKEEINKQVEVNGDRDAPKITMKFFSY